jgi:hypothetical protein
MLIRNISATDIASPDDPWEISFAKGEIMEIVDKTGKWWQAEKEDGTYGSMSFSSILMRACLCHRVVVPSNFFNIIEQNQYCPLDILQIFSNDRGS